LSFLSAASFYLVVSANRGSIKLLGKFVKLTDYTYACNDLTSFEYEAHAMTGNGSYVNLLKVASKNS